MRNPDFFLSISWIAGRASYRQLARNDVGIVSTNLRDSTLASSNASVCWHILCLSRVKKEEGQMRTATAFLGAMALAGSLAAASTSIASDDLRAHQVTDELHLASKTVDENGALRYLALALSNGSDAMNPLRGASSEDGETDRLRSPIPGMDCGIDRIVSYVSCYSSVIGTQEKASNLFTRLINEMEVALPPDRWIKVETDPRIDSIRSYTYKDQGSDAHIDIDLVARPAPIKEPSYIVRVFGWTATAPRLRY
jgi:hypothetical protein